MVKLDIRYVHRTQLPRHIHNYSPQVTVENSIEQKRPSDRLVSNLRHQRNVISLLGHFVSFAVNTTEAALLLNTIYFSSNNSADENEFATDVFAVSLFILPSKIFFVYTFIHTVLSEHLLDFSWVWNIGTLLQTGV